MKCEDFWKVWPEDTPEVGMERAGDGGFSSHLRECPACAASWERRQRLMAGLRSLALESKHWQAPPAAEARLVAEFRRQAGSRGGVRTIHPVFLWGTPAAWATAAALLVGLALFLVNGRRPQAPRTAVSTRVEWAAAGTTQGLVVTGDSLYSDDFIPLPNTEGVASTEDVNLVRVEVPRSAMIQLGLAVSAENASEPVEAEIMLGPDGRARAVRFLSE